MKKKLIALLLTAAMSASLLIGCGGSKEPASTTAPADNSGTSTESADTPYTLKMATNKFSDNYMYEGMEMFKEIAEEESGGSLTIELYADSTLGGQSEIYEGMGMNTIEMAFLGASAAESFFPKITTIGTLFQAESEEHALAMWNSDYAKNLLEEMIGVTNIRCLDFFVEGTRNVWTTVPLNSVDDFAGVKLRVPEVPTFVNAFSALGFNPTPMAMSEVYTGLQTNIIEGLENDTSSVLSNNFHELCKYCYETKHAVSVMTFMITETIWQQLSDNQRAAISSASKQAADYLNSRYYEELEASKALLIEAGVTFVEPSESDRARMEEIMAPITAAAMEGLCTPEDLEALKNLA